jgi:hypothetical protein
MLLLNKINSSIVATYISGVDNVVADKLSRMHVGDAW